MGVVLDAARRHPIEELERARDDPRRDDRRDRFRRILDPVVQRQHRPPRRRARHQLQQDLGDDAERPFRSDEQVLHRVAGDVLDARAAEPRDPAVRQHDFERHHVVARDAVLQPAQPAGVLGDVAADAADAHRAGIRRIEQPMASPPPRRCVMVVTPGCARSVRLRGSTSRIAFICARHITIAPVARHAAAAQPRARPARDDRDRSARRELHAARDVHRARAREHDRLGPLLKRRRPVESVGDDVFWLRQHLSGTDDAGQAVEDGVGQGHGSVISSRLSAVSHDALALLAQTFRRRGALRCRRAGRRAASGRGRRPAACRS